MPQTSAPEPTARAIWAPVSCQLVLTVLLAAGLFELQMVSGFGWWVFNLSALGPLLAALITVLVGRRVGWAVKCTPRISFNARLVRRSLALLVFGSAVAIGALQVYAAARWPLKHVLIGLKPHPFLSDLADPAWYLMWVGLGMIPTLIASEFALRSVLQPTLRQRLGVLESAVVLGIGWAIAQMPWLQGVWGRILGFDAYADAAIYLVYLVLAGVAMALIITVLTGPLPSGQWVSGLFFQWPMMMGMFVVLDEEFGRWQAAGALAISALIICSLVYYVHRQGLPGPLGTPQNVT